MKIALICPDDISFWLFRRGLICALRRLNHEVVLLCRGGPFIAALLDLGARHISIPFERFMSPSRDVAIFLRLLAVMRLERFDCVHNFTPKPNIYGTLAAYLCRVPRIFNSVTGLGYLYQDPGEPSPLLRRISKWMMHALYRRASHLAQRTWFQNPDDIDYFVTHRLISADRCVLVRSSGIDTAAWDPQRYAPELRRRMRIELGVSEGQTLVLMVARALRSKGVLEFFEAARIIAQQRSEIAFRLAGEAEEDAQDGISADRLRREESQTNFRWLGQRSDIPEVIAAADIVVLPSYYREGVPHSLLEAMALAKPIVTTDSVGCREVITHGVNGLMVPPRDGNSLANAILELASSPARRAEMGNAGRAIAERDFSETLVVDRLLREIYRLEAAATPLSQEPLGNSPPPQPPEARRE